MIWPFSNPGRALARLGHRKRARTKAEQRARLIETTNRMAAEHGLPPIPWSRGT